MYRFLHVIFTALFVVLPGVVLIVDLITGRRRGRRLPSAGFILTCCGGVVIAGTVSIVFGSLVGARVGWGQLLLAIYFATGMLLVLKAIDLVVKFPVERLWAWVKRRKNGGVARPALIDLPFAFVRVLMLFAVGVPYLAACLGAYRPKVVPAVDPRSAIGLRFERIDFRAEDGLKLRGWWIPAGDSKRSDLRQTVLLCHGMGAGKSALLPMAKGFVAAGFNVLLFDFRAHGESDGQLTGFGAAEYRDVQAAVKWARQTHSAETVRFFGVGVDVGSAALIAASSRPDPPDTLPDAAALDAIASVGGYDGFPSLARSVLGRVILHPIDRFIATIGTPITGALVGENLARFSPADAAAGVWPQPILFIQSEDDEVISFEMGQDLFKAAAQPKRRMWTQKQSHRELIDDPEVVKSMVRFFNRARPDPVI